MMPQIAAAHRQPRGLRSPRLGLGLVTADSWRHLLRPRDAAWVLPWPDRPRRLQHVAMFRTCLSPRTLAATLCFLLLGACAGDSGEGTPSGAECPEESSLTWETFGENFMASYCTRCHSGSLSGSARNGAPNDHNFETLQLVQDQLEHIDTQAAAGPSAVNEEMPLGAPMPTEAERRQLGEWIACGAP